MARSNPPTVTFSSEDMERLRVVCRDLGTSRAEFIVIAVRQALDEHEGEMREAAQRRAFYAGPKR